MKLTLGEVTQSKLKRQTDIDKWKIQIQDLLDMSRDTGNRINRLDRNQIRETGIRICRREERIKHRNKKDELTRNQRLVWTINTLGNECSMRGFWEVRRS